jgi:hypothetical protein
MNDAQEAIQGVWGRVILITRWEFDGEIVKFVNLTVKLWNLTVRFCYFPFEYYIMRTNYNYVILCIAYL